MCLWQNAFSLNCEGASAKAVHPLPPLHVAYGKQLQAYVFPPQNDLLMLIKWSLPRQLKCHKALVSAGSLWHGSASSRCGWWSLHSDHRLYWTWQGLGKWAVAWGEARTWVCQAAWNDRAFLWFAAPSEVVNCIPPWIQLHSLSLRRLATCLCLLNKPTQSRGRNLWWLNTF